MRIKSTKHKKYRVLRVGPIVLGISFCFRQSDSNSACFSVLLFYEHCANRQRFSYTIMEAMPLIDWFEWNGKRCTEYGIHVSEHPPITLPAERSTFTAVLGRSGSLTVLEDEGMFRGKTVHPSVPFMASTGFVG